MISGETAENICKEKEKGLFMCLSIMHKIPFKNKERQGALSSFWFSFQLGNYN